MVFRAQLLLRCDAVQSESVAQELETSTSTIYKWLRRYQQSGLLMVSKIFLGQGSQESYRKRESKEVFRLTQTSVPPEATHWSLRLMAKYVGISIRQVQQIWQAAGLKSHRLKTFKFSTDPEFAEKVTGIMGFYLNPPDNTLVLSVDEKALIQALDRTQPIYLSGLIR